MATLVAVAVVTAALILLMLVTGHGTPRLGIDLAGGTSVTLTARSDDRAAVTRTNMDTAVGIIQQRVNGLGVSEAEVQTQGDDTIVVTIPNGAGRQAAIDQVGTTAKLYFRPVLAIAPSGSKPVPAPSPTASTPTAAPVSAASVTPAGTGSAGPAGRALAQALMEPAPSAAASAPLPPSGAATPPAPASARPAASEAAVVQDGVPAELRAQFDGLDCEDPAQRKDYQRDPAKPAVACSSGAQGGVWFKSILGPVAVDGTNISSATVGFDVQQGAMWQVQLAFDDSGSKRFAEVTGKLAANSAPKNQFAIVLDGQVVSEPSVNGPIPGGRASISGNFTQKTAEGLANVLSYGALPLTFVKSDVTMISPHLGSDQLRAGLIAGAIGLALVVVYSLVYYRGLAVVSVIGLALAALLTYVLMCLLGAAIGFALTLPAICGAIVAVGITTDSFIVYFERIRDEVREGVPLPLAVRRAWPRARRTVLISDFVSVLAAGVLYVLTVGRIQGFAFALGLTTLLDVAVVFLFAKPLVTLLARTAFFSQGHRLSGLDPQRLGARAPLHRVRHRRPVTPKEA
ncbi:protein translocase subunit SecD [Kitasatospora sp. NPDC086791]|uniref:protein translocase subunit SecD n=1 Tax=Kitasatospora sp. NPDC086791 TaxID=3155178 RepID=UPI003415D119